MSKINHIIPIILAAGKGSRMKTKKNKCSLMICGKPMIEWPIITLRKIGFNNIIVVIGNHSASVRQIISNKTGLIFVEDPFVLGAGHSLFVGLTKIDPQNTTSVLVLYGDDSFLYSPTTIQQFIETYQSSSNPVQLLTVKKPLVSSIGGLKRDKNNNPCGFYTKRELEALSISSVEIVCGAFLFKLKWLKQHLHKMTLSAKGEYLITSLIEVSHQEGSPCGVYQLSNPDEWYGVNTKKDLLIARKLKKQQINEGKV